MLICVGVLQRFKYDVISGTYFAIIIINIIFTLLISISDNILYIATLMLILLTFDLFLLIFTTFISGNSGCKFDKNINKNSRSKKHQ